jgi:hypothetical protein
MVSRRLPFSRYLFTKFHAVGTTIAAIIVLYVCSGSQRVSAKDAFTLFENNTGWADGESFLLVFLLHLTHEKIAGRFSWRLLL